MPDVQPLNGGFMNAPTRVGDLVHRKTTPATPTLHRLLAHVRSRGVDWVPRPVGIDASGVEMLTYIPGQVPHAMPAWIWKPEVLATVAQRQRQWHDATLGFEAPGAPWQFDTHTPAEVICHNDFAPYNTVFEGEVFAGLIDFDLCAPGSRLWDMAYTAYRFVPLMPSLPLDAGQECSPFDAASTRDRLDLFLDAYAAGAQALRPTRGDFLAMVQRRLAALAAWTGQWATTRAEASLAANARMYAAHAAWLGANPWG